MFFKKLQTLKINKLMLILKHSLFVSWLVYISICITLLLYYCFYTWYMPVAKYTTDVMMELQYTSDYRSQKQYELIGYVDLFNENGQILYSGQEYSFSLCLEVPESESNFEIGIFGISGDLYDIEGKKGASFRTTGTLKYRSILLRYILTFIQLPFFLFGSREQKQVLNILLKDNYVDNSYVSATKLLLRIHEKLQFYKVTLIIEAKFTGLKYYLYNWYFTTSLMICSFLFSFIFLILLTNFYDLRSFIMANLTANKKDVEKTVDVYKEDDDRNIAFISTTTRELKSFLEKNEYEGDDSSILIGIDNFRRRYPRLSKKDE